MKRISSPLQLIQHLAAAKQPPGEDFFVFSVRIDNPADPCWDEGFSVMGSWECVMHTLPVQLVCFADQGRKLTVRSFQGDRARQQLSQAFKDEARYQDQKHAQPNN